jgi:clan AA aspartic protease
MGIFREKVTLANPENSQKKISVELVVDSGATYTQLPENLLIDLGIEKGFKRKLKIATGEIIEREIGIVQIQIKEEQGPTWVIFGDKKSEPLLGSVTLEEFGLAVDPVNKALIPVPELML